MFALSLWPGCQFQVQLKPSVLFRLSHLSTFRPSRWTLLLEKVYWCIQLMKIMIVFIIIGGARSQRINDQPKPTVARPFFPQEAHFSPLPQQYAALAAPLHLAPLRRGKAFSQQPTHAFRPTRECIGHSNQGKDHKIKDLWAEWGDWMRWRSRKCRASVGKAQRPANATLHKNMHQTSVAS